MNTIQPSIDSPSPSLADWLADAVALVQRVNARVKAGSAAIRDPGPSPQRLVLTDHRCLELAGLVEVEVVIR